MNKPFDFKTLSNDRSWNYVHDKMRENGQIDCSERFYVTKTREPWKGVLLKTRSIREARTARNYLSAIWGSGSPK